MFKTYNQLKKREKLVGVIAATFFFLAGFTLMLVLLKFISSI
jgi:hypothetical protein